MKRHVCMISSGFAGNMVIPTFYRTCCRNTLSKFHIVMMILLCLVGITTSIADACDCFIAGPYTLHVDQESAQVVWVTSAQDAVDELVGLHDSDGTFLKSVARELSTPRFQKRDAAGEISELDHVRHLARFDGLHPGNEYVYKVRCEDCASTHSGSFMTAPEPRATDPVEFIVVSDGHADSGLYNQVAKAVGEAKPAFVVHTGDLSGGRGEDWDRWIPYFNVARQYLESTVFVPVIGGHDARPNRNFRAFFALNDPDGDPAEEDDKGTWYTFRYGNIDFFMIDHTYDLKPQLEWIEQELIESDADWRIVALHQSVANVGGRGNMFPGLYDDMAELFERHGVDIVISGHDHIYERNLPFGSQGIKPVIYICINSGGNFREIRPAPIVQGGMGQHARMYAHFRVHGNRLVMEAKATYPNDKAGTIIDRLELIKDEDGMYQDEIMSASVKRRQAMKIAHIYTGNDSGLRYSRRDIIANFATYPRDDEPVLMTLNVHRFPIGSELIVYEENDPERWRTAYQEIEITGDTVSFEVIAPTTYGTTVGTWSVNRGTRVAEPIPEFLLNIRLDGKKFEPALVQPSFGVKMRSRSE